MTHTPTQIDQFEPENEREARLVRLLKHDYTFVKRLGRGAFATVYEVINNSLDRTEALKFLSSELTEDRDFLARFKVEAKICAAFTHPNIVTIYNSGAIEDLHYFTMTFVDGPSLSKYVKAENALPLQQVCTIMATVADAIDYSHRKGVIHRDLKASNIMLDKAGKPYVTDFGIAKSDKSLHKTQTGMFIGSPHYVSPEQVEGLAIDHRADIYSLGVCLYALLTHQYPFEGNTALSVIAKRLTHDPIGPHMRNPDLDPELIRIITKALQRYPDQRYCSAAKLSEELRRVCSGAAQPFVIPRPPEAPHESPPPAPSQSKWWVFSRGTWIAIAMAVIAATAVMLFAPWTSPPQLDPRVTALLDAADQLAAASAPSYNDLLEAQGQIGQALAIEPDSPRAIQAKNLVDQKIQSLNEEKIDALRRSLSEAALACRLSIDKGIASECIKSASAVLSELKESPGIGTELIARQVEIEELRAQALEIEKSRQEQLSAQQAALQRELNDLADKAKNHFRDGNLRACAQNADALLRRLDQMPEAQATVYATQKSEMSELKSRIAQHQERRTFAEELRKRIAQVESNFGLKKYDQCVEDAILVKSRIESLPLNLQGQYAKEKETVISLQYKAERAKQHREGQLATLDRVRRKIEEGALGSALSLLENMLAQPGIDEDIELSLQSEKKRIQALWKNKPSNIDAGSITMKKVD